MRTNLISVLLSEAGEPPLSLRRSLLSKRFILRNFSCRGNPLLPRLQLLRERVAAKRLRLLPSMCGLLTSYVCMLGLVDGRYRSCRISFFDVKYILRMGFEDSVILSDSRVALVCIRDRFIDSSVSYVVHSIARLLSPASSRVLECVLPGFLLILHSSGL